MTTIKELAKMTGVSPTTVSNVIHGRTGKVSDEIYRKVQRAIEETHYSLNMGGRMLSKRGSRIIGVILHSAIRLEHTPLEDPFFSVVLGALEAAIRMNGYFMMMYTSAQPEESLRMAASWNVEGLVVLGCNGADCEEMFTSATVPVVFIDAYYDAPHPLYNNVGLEDRAGGHAMAEYLIGLGHTRIAFLADAEVPVGVDHERYEGVLDALDAHGIPHARDNYIHIHYDRAERHAMFRRRAPEMLERFTALFFASDLYAADGVGILADLGVRIPDRISVCGFDGNQYSLICRPTLTTIAQTVPDKAARAIELLLKRISGQEVEESNIRLKAALCVRDSTRDIRGEAR